MYEFNVLKRKVKHIDSIEFLYLKRQLVQKNFAKMKRHHKFGTVCTYKNTFPGTWVPIHTI